MLVHRRSDVAKRKAKKKLTKAGRKRTGSTPRSGKRRSDRAAGARPSTKRPAGRRAKRASGSTAGATRSRRTRPKARKNVRHRAGTTTKPMARARRANDEGEARGMPLRDLIRGGLPRSRKAHRAPGTHPMTPWSQRRTKSGHGLRADTTIYQAQQTTRERYGGMKFAVPKRG
jgi:hypothetical protein